MTYLGLTIYLLGKNNLDPDFSPSTKDVSDISFDILHLTCIKDLNS